MYQLKVQQLRLWLFVGWGETERANRQPIDVDLAIHLPRMPNACNTDTLEDTVCYDHCVSAVLAACTDRPFHLLEYLAKFIGDVVQAYYQDAGMAVGIQVTVNKICPPVAGILGGVSFHYVA